MALTETDIIEALRPVQDPELHRSIVDLGMVRGVQIDAPRVDVGIALTIAGCPLRSEIQNRVTEALTSLDGLDTVTIDFSVMTDEERVALREQLHGSPGATAGTHEGHPGPARPLGRRGRR
jgi:ATP-binding protein involved in chromosome partitioning